LSQQFLRKAELIIGDTATDELLIIKDPMRIAFTVDKTATSEANKGSIQVYNLSDITRDNIDKVDQFLTLRTGYEDIPLVTMFTGNISFFKHVFNPPEIITMFECRDGGTRLARDRVSISFEAGVLVSTAIQEILQRVNWPTRDNTFFILFDITKKLSNGYAFNGLAKNAINELTKIVDLQWTFHNDVVEFIQKGTPKTNAVIQISKETGMISVPEKTDNKGTRTKRVKPEELEAVIPKENEPGYVVRSLLKPSAEPGGRIALKSERLNIDDQFPIEEVSHAGDTFEDIWETRIKILI